MGWGDRVVAKSLYGSILKRVEKILPISLSRHTIRNILPIYPNRGVIWKLFVYLPSLECYAETFSPLMVRPPILLAGRFFVALQ